MFPRPLEAHECQGEASEGIGSDGENGRILLTAGEKVMGCTDREDDLRQLPLQWIY